MLSPRDIFTRAIAGLPAERPILVQACDLVTAFGAEACQQQLQRDVATLAAVSEKAKQQRLKLLEQLIADTKPSQPGSTVLREALAERRAILSGSAYQPALCRLTVGQMQQLLNSVLPVTETRPPVAPEPADESEQPVL